MAVSHPGVNSLAGWSSTPQDKPSRAGAALETHRSTQEDHWEQGPAPRREHGGIFKVLMNQPEGTSVPAKSWMPHCTGESGKLEK